MHTDRKGQGHKCQIHQLLSNQVFKGWAAPALVTPHTGVYYYLAQLKTAFSHYVLLLCRVTTACMCITRIHARISQSQLPL